MANILKLYLQLMQYCSMKRTRSFAWMLNHNVAGTGDFSKHKDDKLSMAREMMTNETRFHDSDSIN